MSTPTGPSSTFRILLVEDNEDTRMLMEQLLRAAGYEVHTAGTKRGAVRDFPDIGGELLLSDIGLPDGDGRDLLHELRQAGCWLPYGIAMSGFGALADVAASMEAGFSHHLVKPIDWDTLSRLLDDARHKVAALQ